MKIRPVGADLFRADRQTDGRMDRDRQTDTTKLIAAFRSFADAPKTYKPRQNLKMRPKKRKSGKADGWHLIFYYVIKVFLMLSNDADRRQ